MEATKRTPILYAVVCTCGLASVECLSFELPFLSPAVYNSTATQEVVLSQVKKIL